MLVVTHLGSLSMIAWVASLACIKSVAYSERGRSSSSIAIYVTGEGQKTLSVLN